MWLCVCKMERKQERENERLIGDDLIPMLAVHITALNSYDNIEARFGLFRKVVVIIGDVVDRRLNNHEYRIALASFAILSGPDLELQVFGWLLCSL